MPENHSTTPNTVDTQPDEGWEGLARASSEWPQNHEGLQLFKKHHVDRVLGERGLGHLVVSKEDSAGATFLHKQNPQLNASPEVEHTVAFLRQQGAKIPDKPGKRIEAYLDFIADHDYANDGILTGERESIDRQIDTIVIKHEDVPESYFELQKRIAREQGHGDIPISDYARGKMIETLQKEQKRSLERWAGYLSSPTNEVSYPTWFKKYAFDNVQKLGVFDKEKGEFTKRSKGTAAPFADLNPEALGYVLDALAKDQRGERSEDQTLANLAKSGNFAKLYAHSILRATSDPERSKTTDGSWRKFDQIPYDDLNPESTHHTAQELADSLQGHGTGWCTAGEETAQGQLSRGDFYVYYSKDAEGNDTVPRVAIRMQDGEVAEVRGIGDNQNLEGEMMDIAQEKFRSLPGGERYEKKAEDMRYLTEIERLMESDPHVSLTAEDLRFLYELDDDIQSFRQEEWGDGYRDPRIDELISKRDAFVDMAKAYDVGIHEIATNDTFNKHTKVVIGDLDCKNIAQRFTQRSLSSTAATRLQTSDFEGQDIDDYLIPEPIYAVTGKIVGFDQSKGLNVDCLEEIVAMEGRSMPAYEDLFKVADSFTKGAQLVLLDRGMDNPDLRALVESADKFGLIDINPLAKRLLADKTEDSLRLLDFNLRKFHGLTLELAQSYIKAIDSGFKTGTTRDFGGSGIDRIVKEIIESDTFILNTQELNDLLVEASEKEYPASISVRSLIPIIEEFSELDPRILDKYPIEYGTNIALDPLFLIANASHFRSMNPDEIAERAMATTRSDLKPKLLEKLIPHISAEAVIVLFEQYPFARRNEGYEYDSIAGRHTTLRERIERHIAQS